MLLALLCAHGLALLDSSDRESGVHVTVQVGDELAASDVLVRWRAEGAVDYSEVATVETSACLREAELPAPPGETFQYFLIALDDTGGVLGTFGTADVPFELTNQREDMGDCEDADCSCAPHMFYCQEGPEPGVSVPMPAAPPPRPPRDVLVALAGGIARSAGATMTPELGVRVLGATWLGVATRIARDPEVLARLRQGVGHGVEVALSLGGLRTATAGASVIAGTRVAANLELFGEAGALVDLDRTIDLGVSAGIAWRL